MRTETMILVFLAMLSAAIYAFIAALDRPIHPGDKLFVGVRKVRVANERGVPKPEGRAGFPTATSTLEFGKQCSMESTDLPSEVVRLLPDDNLLMKNVTSRILGSDSCPQDTQFIVSKRDALRTDKEYREYEQQARRERAEAARAENKAKEQLRRLLQRK